MLPEIAGEPATLTGSDVSIAALLDYVNRCFPDVLPEDVLRHYGHEERPDGKLGKSAKYSRTADGLEQLQEENRELREQVNRFQKELRSAQRRIQNARESRDQWRDRATFHTERVCREIIKAYHGMVSEEEIHDGIKKLTYYAARKDGISSAYGKSSNAAQFIRSSGLVYLDENRKRTEKWMQGLGLQLPADTTIFGSIGRITYLDGKVKIESVPYEQ